MPGAEADRRVANLRAFGSAAAGVGAGMIAGGAYQLARGKYSPAMRASLGLSALAGGVAAIGGGAGARTYANTRERALNDARAASSDPDRRGEAYVPGGFARIESNVYRRNRGDAPGNTTAP